MKKFGRELMEMFLIAAWPQYRRSPPELVQWSDVVELFFNSGPMILKAATDTGRVWSPAAVTQLDNWLVARAARGDFLGNFSLDPEPAEELWLRWSWVITGAQAEDTAGVQKLDLPVPSDAPDALKGMAVLLYFLAGPGRDYPK